MAEVYLGQMLLVPYNFAPYQWALANGQLLSIASNTALFSLLGTNYGGNGTSIFGLPDLRGRVPISSGQGSGLSDYVLGEVSGEESHTLTYLEMATHNHFPTGTDDFNSASKPTDAVFGTGVSLPNIFGTKVDQTLNQSALGFTGSGQPHENRSPFLTLNWIIAMAGLYPPRS